MQGIKSIFELMLITGCLWHRTHSQCSGAKKVIYPGVGKIQYPNNRDRDITTKCNWEFSSIDRDYILELTFVKLGFSPRNSRRVPGKPNVCSTTNVLKINEDQVCEKNVRPGSSATPTLCKVYYSSPTCNTAAYRSCKTIEQTSFPVRVTYDTRSERIRWPLPTTGEFMINYEYKSCPSSDCLTDDEDCATSGSGQTTIDSPPETTEMEVAMETISFPFGETTDETIDAPTDETILDQQEANMANSVEPNNHYMIPISVMGVVIFILLVIIAVLAFLLRASRRRRAITSATPHQDNNAPEPAVAYIQTNRPRVGTSTGNGLYFNVSATAPEQGAIPEALKNEYYVNVPNGRNSNVENPYEMPMKMQLYENNQR